MDVDRYCREIEAYLCQKNDGHLIRIAGPSFALVCGWTTRGVPLKIAFLGIDRYFDRYYARGPRRRPARIDFCEAEVLDAFDEWRRAVGVRAWLSADAMAAETPAERKRPALTAHLDRVVARLTMLRGGGKIGGAAAAVVDRVVRELDAARAGVSRRRGQARAELLERLLVLDREVLGAVQADYDAARMTAIRREAEDDLEPFRQRMTAEAFRQATEASIERLIRQRAGVPQIAFG